MWEALCDFVIFPLFLQSKKENSQNIKMKVSYFLLLLLVRGHAPLSADEGAASRVGDASAAVWGVANIRSGGTVPARCTRSPWMLSNRTRLWPARGSHGHEQENITAKLEVPSTWQDVKGSLRSGTLSSTSTGAPESSRKPFFVGIWCWRTSGSFSASHGSFQKI